MSNVEHLAARFPSGAAGDHKKTQLKESEYLTCVQHQINADAAF